MLKWLLPALLALSAAAATPFERWAGKPAETWKKAFPIRSKSLATRVCGATTAERFPLSPCFPVVGAPLGEVRLDWLDAAIPATGYRRSLDLATGIATTSFERGGIRITETIFISSADGVLVIHLHADRPGALNFQVALSGRSRIEDRREILSPGLHAWVLPFESDVETASNALTVRGEGEALVIVAAGGHGLSERFKDIGRKYDSRDSFPDLIRVWAGLLQVQKRGISGD